MIKKEVHIALTKEEIESPETIELLIHVHEDTDPENKEGITYTIKYPKSQSNENLN